MMKPQILFIDDDIRLLDALRRTLRHQRERWELAFVDEAEDAWTHLQTNRVSAVVCDIRMPGLSGFDLLQRISQSEETKHVPIAMISGLNDETLKRQSLELGAVDLIQKPIDYDLLITRLEYMLQMKTARDKLAEFARNISDPTRAGLTEAGALLHGPAYLSSLYGVARQCDSDSDHHITRVGWFCRELAAELGMEREFQEQIFWAAPLHDIGKIGIPESILRKEEKLTPGEWTVVQQHAAFGETILRGHAADVMDICGEEDLSEILEFDPQTLLSLAATISMTHHEKWNGSGYPLGLSGTQIPLPGRITMVADVFDSMISSRPYHDPVSPEMAADWIRHLGGQFFDPSVVEAFERSLDHLTLISEALAQEIVLEKPESLIDSDGRLSLPELPEVTK